MIIVVGLGMRMHKNARLTFQQRRQMVQLIQNGTAIAKAGKHFGISEMTALKWWHRWKTGGDAALEDRSSARRNNRQITPQQIELMVQLRRTLR